jgi:hypothetical protein
MRPRWGGDGGTGREFLDRSQQWSCSSKPSTGPFTSAAQKHVPGATQTPLRGSGSCFLARKYLSNIPPPAQSCGSRMDSVGVCDSCLARRGEVLGFVPTDPGVSPFPPLARPGVVHREAGSHAGC